MIAEDEWLVVIDRQRVFAGKRMVYMGLPDSSYHTTDGAFARLAKAFGDRVIYYAICRPAAAAKRLDRLFQGLAAVFGLAPDDPMYDLTADTAELIPCSGQLRHLRQVGGSVLSEAIKGAKKITVCGVATDCCDAHHRARRG